MSLLRNLALGLRRLLCPAHHRRELDEELRAYVEASAQEKMRAGMDADHALHEARAEMGSVDAVKDWVGDTGWESAIEALVRDLRYAVRALRRSPGFTLVAVLTLGLGIGANTAVFSVVDAVLLRPLPYPHPDRLVSVHSWYVRGTPHPDVISYPNFFDFRKYNRAFEHMVCYHDSDFALSGVGMPVHVSGEIVSWDLFELLRVRPIIGRGFLPQEENAGQHVVVLSNGLWREKFAGDPSVVGRSITLGGVSYVVIGVMPAGFLFPVQSPHVQVWTTLAIDAASDTATPMTAQRGARILDVVARLKPGVSIAAAQAQLDTIAANLAQRYPNENKNTPTTLVRPELEEVAGDTRRPLWILLGAVGLVLLIACANIANLLLARTAEREREFAVRTAIGAARRIIIRQLLTESVLLAAIGCAAGVLLAMVGIQALRPLSASIPRIDHAGVDARVLGFSITAALITSLLFSLAPVLQLARRDFAGSLQHAARGHLAGTDRLRNVLVVAQITLGLVLLSGAALLTASFMHLLRRDVGFNPDRVLAFSVAVPDSYRQPKQIDFNQRLFERLKTLPGVVSVAGGFPLPLTGSQIMISFDIEDRRAPEYNRPHADVAIVTPGYFQTLCIPLLEGRQFSERDDASAPTVLIVNRAFADKFFPSENVIGKRIRSGASDRNGKTPMREIVGVVGNARQSPIKEVPDPIYYFPYKQLPWFVPPVVMRTSLPPMAIESAARLAVTSLDKQVPVYDVRTMQDLLSEGIAPSRFLMLLLGSFAAIALLLTIVGLYGVLAYSVLKRTREIGLRVALGARRGLILGLVLRHAMLLVVTGVAIGLAATLATSKLLATVLYGISPHNPALLGIATAAVALTATIAAYLPARRAASIDPMQALRSE